MADEDTGPRPSSDESQGWALLAVCWSFVLCATVTTILRLWIRARLTRNLGWDDAIMTIALFTTLVGASFITAGVVNGLGRHEFYLSASQRRNSHALGWADWIQTFITLALVKISICLFLLRIVESRTVKRLMYALIAITTLFTAVFTFVFLGVCRPLRAHWEKGVEGKCLSNTQIEATLIAQGVCSILADLILAALPILFLRNLQINIRTKIGLCLLMGLGIITAICCTVRTALSAGATTNPDTTWAISANVAWRLPEVNIGIVCANAPIFRPLYLYMRGRLATQLRSKQSASAHGGERVSRDRDRLWPSNARNARGEGGNWVHGSEDTSVEVEMGLGGGGEGREKG